MLKFIRTIDYLSETIGKTFGWVVLVLMAGTCYEVFCRYVLDDPTDWAFDMSYMFYGAMFLMGGAYTLAKGGHVRGDFMYRKWQPRTQAKVDFVLYILFFFPGKLKIAILSRNKSLYSTNRLYNAGTKRGHHIEIIDYLRCYINIGENQTAIYYNSNKLGNYDSVLPRIGASQTSYGTAIVRQFEMTGNFVVNKSDAIIASRDKLRSLQILTQHGIDMPITGYASHTIDIQDVIEKVGKTPLIMKLLQGTQGNGMVLAETMKAAESVMSAFKQVDADILVQEFIKESSGIDIRAIVVGNKVVAAMQRVAPEGEFRSNVHRGAATKHIDLTSEEKEIAIKSTKVLGLNVAGVDLMRSKRGPLVLEVNSSPGLQGIELLTGADVAGEIISYIESIFNNT